MTIQDLFDAANAGTLNRRDVLRRSVALGLSAPVIAGLLAACGGDDDDGGDATATESDGATTEEATEEATSAATEAETEEATESAEETGTEDATETETEAATEPEESDEESTATESEVSAPTGEWIEFDIDPLTMGKEFEEPASTGGTLIISKTGDLKTTNPVLLNDDPSYSYAAMVWEALVDVNPDTLEPVGRLADAWQVSDDQLQWSLRLREGVTWHDGNPLVADDVKITYDLHRHPETGSSYTGALRAGIESIDMIDERTVTFTIPAPYPDFLVDIPTYPIIPAHIWADVAPADIMSDPGSTGQDASRVIGTGPFKFEEWVIEDHASAVANPDFWGGAPVLEKYIQQMIADQSATIQALKTGTIDFAYLDPASVADLEGSDVAIFDFDSLAFYFYGTNLDTEHTTLFQDPEVRKAMLYAIDREAMVESILYGYGTVAVGTIPVLSWAYNPDGIDPELHYAYDPEKAKQLLDSAGWIVGDDGVRAKDGERLSFSMHVNSGNDVFMSYAVAYQEFWRGVGIEMTPEPEPFQALVERITQTHDFETFIVSFGWSPVPDQSGMWACAAYPSGFNIVKYCNPDVDELLARAASETDQETRIELYTEFQNTLLADLPMAVTEFPRLLYGVANRVHNLEPNAINYWYNAHRWWIDA